MNDLCRRLLCLLPLSFLTIALSLLAACQTSSPDEPRLGLQSGYQSYIPARIAVLPCRPWPAKYPALAEDHQPAPTAVVSKLCQQYDDFVIKSFGGQAFMKGFTPALVNKLLATAGKPGHLLALSPLWAAASGGDCDDCSTPGGVYQNRLASLPAWRKWLQDLSQMTRYSDAALLPFLLGASQWQRDDRGLLTAARSASIVLLLVDTNHGALLWQGKREAVSSNGELRSAKAASFPPFPAWESLPERLFLPDLWREFPGKQWY